MKYATHLSKDVHENGLIIISAGTFKNVLRILSPLVITDEQLRKGLDILEEEIKIQLKK